MNRFHINGIITYQCDDCTFFIRHDARENKALSDTVVEYAIKHEDAHSAKEAKEDKPEEAPLPTIGRIVIYTSHLGEESPAIVTKVSNGSRYADLTIFKRSGSFFTDGVRFDENGGASTWKWPSRNG